MVFSSVIFLFLFLPVSLACYYLAGNFLRNTVLLLMSLFFYAWGEQFYVLVLLASIGLNYIVGMVLQLKASRSWQKRVLWLGIFANLALLVFFKYLNFLVDIFNSIFSTLGIAAIEHSPLSLPIGISFFTFQALSYLVDVYKTTTPVQRNVFSLGLYIASFPQLIAGPIVRYHDVATQIVKRKHSFEMFSDGVERFIFGLSKKVLIANPLGAMADNIFAFDASVLTTGAAWLGIACYTLQIYFDFSGYSDMAIGLGRMFGFRFLENFNYPYISRSIQEFWRRWHISLSNWFRDYLYIPLGGNRGGEFRTGINLLIVFFLCGLWHGASWNFIFWGLAYGCFLVAERGMFGVIIRRLPRWVQHAYVLFVVVNAWVLFRVETVPGIGIYFTALYTSGHGLSIPNFLVRELDFLFMTTLCAGILFSTPIYPNLYKKINCAIEKHRKFEAFKLSAKLLMLSMLLLLSVAQLAGGSYNPFIYFRF